MYIVALKVFDYLNEPQTSPPPHLLKRDQRFEMKTYARFSVFLSLACSVESFVPGRVRSKPNDLILFLSKSIDGSDLKEQRQHAEIGCCFCGTPVIGADLKEMCDKYTDVRDQSVFTLHKENF